jgi:alkaline phosphatase
MFFQFIGVYAQISDRDWEYDSPIQSDGCDPNNIDDIAEQLVHGDVGKNLKVILGGGRRNFVPNTMPDDEGVNGFRRDGQNLVDHWKNLEGGRDYIWNREQLMNVNPATTDHLLGLFGSSHIEYYADIVENNLQDRYPSLADMTGKAIDILSKNEQGYFLFVEGGRIDHGHHDNWAKRALEETRQFSEAIALAVSKLNMSETLVVRTLIFFLQNKF